MKLFALLIGACVVCFVQSKDRNNLPHKVVCYFEPGKFQPEDINPHICTHINYAFAILQNNTIQSSDKTRDEGEIGEIGKGAMIRRLVKLREFNPHLTILMAIGGWGEGSDKYSLMAEDPDSRKVFIDSVVNYLRYYDLDGLDLDWEYPGFPRKASSRQMEKSEQSDLAEQDKQNFVTLLAELKEAFVPFEFILTAAVSGRPWQCDVAYDIPALNQLLDWFNLMLYDYTGQGASQTSHNAPLFQNANNAVGYWIRKGADPHKLVFGLPLYGYSFTLANSSEHGLYNSVTGDGHISGNYGNICQVIKNPGWHTVFDRIAKVPYAYNATKWVTFDNLESIQTKLKFLKDKNLGGSMVWSVGLDDWQNNCGDGKYPLMKLQMSMLNNVTVDDVHVPVPAVYRMFQMAYKRSHIYPKW